MTISDLDASESAGRTPSGSRPARERGRFGAPEPESTTVDSKDSDIDDAEIEEDGELSSPLGAPRLSTSPPTPRLGGANGGRSPYEPAFERPSTRIDGPPPSPIVRTEPYRAPVPTPPVSAGAAPVPRPVPPRPVPTRSRADNDRLARMPGVGRIVVRVRHRPLPEPGGPNPWWRRIAKFGVAVVFACSFALSFAALHSLALGAGIDRSLAWMFPVCIDTLAIVASATAVAVQSGGRKMTWSPWAVVLIFLAVSIAGNAQHAYSTNDITVSTHIAVAVSAVPPIALGLALHLLLLMARQRTGRFAAPQKVKDGERQDGSTED